MPEGWRSIDLNVQAKAKPAERAIDNKNLSRF